MPKPVYILCAHDIIEDKTSGLLTAVKIVEKLTLSRPAEGQTAIPLPQVTMLRALTVWQKEDGDGGEFDSETIFRVGNKEIAKTAHSFSFPPDKLLHRFIFIFPIFGIPIESDAPSMTIESRIRQTGSENWVSQYYPIACDVVSATAPKLS